MAGTTKFEIKDKDNGMAKARKRLQLAKAEMSKLNTVSAKIAVFLDQWVQKNFRSEGGNVGKWAPFAPATLHYIELYDPKRMPAKLLQKTGHLRASFLPFTRKDSAGIGSDLPYSKPQNDRRRMLPKTKEILPNIRQLVVSHVKQSLGLANK